jgi:hypothetical protein
MGYNRIEHVTHMEWCEVSLSTKEDRCIGVCDYDCINLAQDRDQWRAVVNTAVNILLETSPPYSDYQLLKKESASPNFVIQLLFRNSFLSQNFVNTRLSTEAQVDETFGVWHLYFPKIMIEYGPSRALCTSPVC